MKPERPSEHFSQQLPPVLNVLLRQELTPTVDVPPSVLLDCFSVEAQGSGALVRRDGSGQLVALRVSHPELHEQWFELAAGGDGLRKVADLALDRVKLGSALLKFPIPRPRRQLLEHAIDYGHDDRRLKHVAGERSQQASSTLSSGSRSPLPHTDVPSFEIGEAAVDMRGALL